MSGRLLADVLPLAPMQAGLLYHASLDGPHPDPYLVQCRFAIDGPVDAVALRDAVGGLLDRHPNLRAAFRHAGLDEPVQVVPQRVAVPWDEVDLSGMAPATAAAELRRRLAADRIRGFDVTRPPLLRCVLFRGADRADLVLTFHHILVDGWSMPILARELAALYAGAGLPPAPPFRNYLAWLRGQDGAASARAWQAALADLSEGTRVAGEVPPRGVLPPDRIEFELPAELTEAVRRRARRAGVTVNTVAQVAWALVLARMTGRADVVFGAVVSGRPPDLPGVEEMVGLFVNTVPVRVRLRPGERTGRLLARLQEEQFGLNPHHGARLAEVQGLAGRGDLFDTVLAFENFPRGTDPSGGPRLVDVWDATHYPLTVAVLSGERLWLRLGYRPDCFDPAEAHLVAGRLRRALEALAADEDAEVDRVDVLPEAERRRVLVDWNDTAYPRPRRTVPERFAEQAARTPDTVAVEHDGRTLTYRELADRAADLAGRLVAAGAGPETAVGLLLDRSAELVTAQLAVLRTGGHYVPLDPGQPAARLAWLVRDARVRLVLADRAPDWLPGEVRVLAPDASPAAPEAGTVPPAAARPDSAANVMYTSGSTGVPKGVVVTHDNVVELALDRRFAGAAPARVLLHSPYTFDAATYEVWVPLLTGGTVVVAPPGPLEPHLLKAQLTQGRITSVWLTAELFRTVAELAPDALAGLAEVWAGGDVVDPVAVRRVRAACPDTLLVNGYGPTETTTFATCHPIGDLPEGGTVPIGGPLDNTEAYVLDARLRPVPVGTVGELYLAGTGTARGYLGQPARTAERFVAAPYASGRGARMYRTGDLVRWTAGGVLEFVGRSDSQAKIRGFRVEPGEVEAVLAECPGVRRAVVVTRPGAGGGRLLIAYLVPNADGDLDEVRRYAARRLPGHLLPAGYELVDRIPLTPHGKVDRSALPEPRGWISDGPPVAPRSPREKALCELFATVLGVPAIGPDDNFFEAGGHSLHAMRLVATVERTLGIRVPLSAVFEASTPATLAARLDGPVPAGLSLPPVLTLRAEGDRGALFCPHHGMGMGTAYAGLLPYLAPGHPVYALQSTALGGHSALPTSIGEMAVEYLARIRTVQPRGPYALLGWSFGGLLAYEMAVRLRQAGEEVNLLAIVDSVPVLGAEPPAPLDPVEIDQDTLGVLVRYAEHPTYRPAPGPLDRAAVFAAVRDGAGPLRGAEQAQLATMLEVRARHVGLAMTYRPRRYDGRLIFFSATAEPNGLTSEAKAAAWRRTAAEVHVHEIACTHDALFKPANAAEIAAVVNSQLREV